MKKALIAFLLAGPLSAAYLSAQADIIPKVAVVDINAVNREVNKSSSAVQQVERLKDSFNEEIKKREEALQTLKQQRLEASNEQDEKKASDLDKLIAQRETDLKNYRQSASSQLQSAAARVKPDAEFLRLIQSAIMAVAEAKGYSLVFSSSGSGLVYWNDKVDITRDVTNYIIRVNAPR